LGFSFFFFLIVCLFSQAETLLISLRNA